MKNKNNNSSALKQYKSRHRFYTALQIIGLVLIIISMLGILFNSNKNTLEDYAKHHKDFTSTISSELNLKGFEGDVSIDDNSIIVDVDIKDKLNKMRLTDEFKESVKSGFEQSLDFISDGVEEGIQNLEEKTKIKKLTVTININCGTETLCTRTYSLK